MEFKPNEADYLKDVDTMIEGILNNLKNSIRKNKLEKRFKKLKQLSELYDKKK